MGADYQEPGLSYELSGCIARCPQGQVPRVPSVVREPHIDAAGKGDATIYMVDHREDRVEVPVVGMLRGTELGDAPDVNFHAPLELRQEPNFAFGEKQAEHNMAGARRDHARLRPVW